MTLNIKGGGLISTQSKWNELCQLIREKDIDMLAIQETYLDPQKTKDLNFLFERQVHFISCLDPNTPNAKGVAFVLSKKTIK